MVSQRKSLTKPWSCVAGKTVLPTLSGGQEPTQVVSLVCRSSVRLACPSQRSQRQFLMDKLVSPPSGQSVKREVMWCAPWAVVLIMRL